MSSPNFPKYETERIMAEAFYGYYPHSKKLNKAIWDFFRREDCLWLSEIKKISEELKIDIATVVIYIQLLSGKDSDNPPLLRQNFYKLNDDGQLELMSLSPEKVLQEFKANPNQKPEEAFIDWAKSVYSCWEAISNQEEQSLLPDASFNFATNSLWNILQNW